MHKRCIIPGSFDPVTLGHLNVFERASALYESVVVAVLRNSAKQPFFPMEERVRLIEKATAHLPNVRTEAFGGLTVDFAHEKKAGVILRGLRMVSDFDYEQQIAALNHMMAPDVETVFIMTDHRYGFLSAGMVREIGRMGGDISKMVPETVLEDITRAFARK